MPIDTNISPYYDDFQEQKNFYKVLFKPGVAVQSRELTQVQSILQNQVRRIGDYLFRENDKVTGPKPSVNVDARTIRLADLDASGRTLDVNTLLGTYVTAPNSDVLGLVEFVYEKDNPNIGDTKSVVISLLKFNSTNDGMFEENTEIHFYVDYTDALNKVTPNFKAITTTDVTKNAFCTTKEFSNDVILTNPNSTIEVGDLLVHPRLTKKVYVTEIRSPIEIIVNTAPGIVIGNDRISFVRKATSPTLILTQDVAIFYKRGYFVRCNQQKIVPDKNTAHPTKIVGLFAEDQLITSDDDNSLLDPALESSNYFALGADRLKIDLSLISVDYNRFSTPENRETYSDDRNVDVSIESFVYTSGLVLNTEDFISLIKFNKGEIEYVKELSTESPLDDKLAERTYDESGSYTVDRFTIVPQNSTEEDKNLYFTISSGKAYVGGYQVKTIAPTEIQIPKNLTTETSTNYNINTSQGNYYKVVDVRGGLVRAQQRTSGETFLELHNVVNPIASNTRVGVIGFKNLEYDTFTGSNVVYKLFTNYYAPEKEVPVSWAAWSQKFKLPESEGRYIANVLYETNNEFTYSYGPILFRGSYLTPSSGLRFYGLHREPDNYGVARWVNRWRALGRDINKIYPEFITAALADPNDNPRVQSNTKGFAVIVNGSPFYDGFVDVSNVRSVVGVSNEYTSHSSSASYGTPSFYAKIDNTGLDSAGRIRTFDKKSSDTLVFPLGKDFVKNTENIQFSYTRVIKNISFSGGVYSRTLSAPETFNLGNGTIPSSTARANFILVIKTGATGNVSVGTWNFERGTVSISASSTTVTINVGDGSFNGTADISMIVETDNSPIRTKTLVRDHIKFLDIQKADIDYDLGKSDINYFKGVYRANTGAYKGQWNSSTSYSYNDVVSNQGLVYISKVNGANVALNNGNAWGLLNSEPLGFYYLDDGQRDSYYDHGYVRYTGPSSYLPGECIVIFDYYTHSGDGPIVATSYPAGSYALIKPYVSVTDARRYNLRDCIDFRPRRIDDSIYQNYDSAVFPISDTNTELDVTYYIGRIDRVYVSAGFENFGSPYNKFFHVKGVESTAPVAPEDASDLKRLSIATIEIPPYSTTAFDVRIRYDDNRRYTMKDIGNIEDATIELTRAVRLQNIEISTLRSLILDDNGTALLKTGILVEDFSSFDKTDLVGGQFNAVIDETNRECYPTISAFNVDLDLIQDFDIYVFNDIVTMKYVEEIFLSQLEANGFVDVNPGGIIASQGRAIINKKNSFVVDLLSTAGALLAQAVAVKTLAAYAATVLTGTVGQIAWSTAGPVAYAAAAQGEGVLAVAWKAAREIGLNFFEAVQSVDGIVKLVTDAIQPYVDIGRALWEYTKGGFQSVIDYFTTPTTYSASGGVSATAGSGTAVSGAATTVGSAQPFATNMGYYAGGISDVAAAAWADAAAGFAQIGKSLANILNQSPITTLEGIGAGITQIAIAINTAAFSGLVAAANALATVTANTAIAAQTAGLAAGVQSAALWVAEAPVLVQIAIAVVVVYVAVKVVQAVVNAAKKIWKKLTSDINAKQNIEFIRKDKNGLNLYSFEYINELKDTLGHGRYKGYIAQEVEKVYPNAVSVGANGYKCINYSLIGR